jgi:hypothetical protein
MPVSAQKSFGLAKYTAMCSYYGETISGTVDAYESGPTAEKVVKNIMSVIGLKPNFELRASNVPNAAAVMINSKRYILYNPAFMDKINNASGTNWAAISILAHEIGHHLNGHTLDNVGSRPQTELDADEFSGFVLRKMGASLLDAQAVMSIIASPNGTNSHPPKKDRLTYIATGWSNAGGQSNTAVANTVASKPVVVQPVTVVDKPVVADRTAVINKPIPQQKTAVAQSAPSKTMSIQKPMAPKPAVIKRAPVAMVNTQPSRKQKIQESVLSNKNIKSDAYFSSDPSGKYYVTAKGNLVQVQNDRVYIIASLSKSDKQGYSLMFADTDTSSIYVASGGLLVNGNCAKIGYVKARQ